MPRSSPMPINNRKGWSQGQSGWRVNLDPPTGCSVDVISLTPNPGCHKAHVKLEFQECTHKWMHTLALIIHYVESVMQLYKYDT